MALVHRTFVARPHTSRSIAAPVGPHRCKRKAATSAPVLWPLLVQRRHDADADPGDDRSRNRTRWVAVGSPTNSASASADCVGVAEVAGRRLLQSPRRDDRFARRAATGSTASTRSQTWRCARTAPAIGTIEASPTRSRNARRREDEAIVRRAPTEHSRLGDCASPRATPATRGRVLLPPLVLAAEQARANDSVTIEHTQMALVKVRERSVVLLVERLDFRRTVEDLPVAVIS
jgi:hypothetical protein